MVLILEKPSVGFLHKLTAFNQGWIVSKKAVDEMGEKYKLNPIGTGPFAFEKWTAGAEVRLAAYKSYFEGAPKFDELQLRIIKEETAAAIALEKGEIDYIGSVAGPEVERLRQTPGIAVVSGTGGSGGSVCEDVLIPNLSRRPLGDLRVRRAIAMALDRQFIVDHVYFGQGRPATGPISHLLTWA